MKLKAIGLAIIAFGALLIKHLLGKNEKLEREIKIKDIVKENHEKQEADEIEILNNEEQEIETDLQEHRRLSRHDRASRL